MSLFPLDLASVLARVDAVDPVAYARSRNFVDGAVTRLSPYLARGLISTRTVFLSLKQRGLPWSHAEKLVQELAWRDYFQRAWQARGDGIFQDLARPQPNVRTGGVPRALVDADTGIDTIDAHLRELVETGYMHNHVRMYVASIMCTVGRVHWRGPATWMYAHLLDGDWASNTCSWQWVAGAFSAKPYVANQENISRYTRTPHQASYLDADYAHLPPAEVPGPLRDTVELSLSTSLPVTPPPRVDPLLPLVIYTSYNLDPSWRAGFKANRVLLLEPSHFGTYPVSTRVLDFVISLGRTNIPDLQVFAGEANGIPHLRDVPSVHRKEHPAFRHLPGEVDERDWLVPEVEGFFPSFFAFWKRVERHLRW